MGLAHIQHDSFLQSQLDNSLPVTSLEPQCQGDVLPTLKINVHDVLQQHNITTFALTVPERFALACSAKGLPNLADN